MEGIKAASANPINIRACPPKRCPAAAHSGDPAMPNNKSAVLRLLMFLTVFLLPSWVEKPLSDADKAKQDERLYGTWKVVGKQFSPLRYEIVCIGKSSQEGAPAGMMSFVDVENDAQHRLRVRGPTSFFTTSVGKATYANLCLEDLEQGPLIAAIRLGGTRGRSRPKPFSDTWLRLIS
jgi:hypothetical protein